jgi:nitrogen fixation/metabolism regulation signal transduction histidine kinase
VNRLRNRLIAVFLLATLLPLAVTLWTTLRLLDSSLQMAPLAELETTSKSLERAGRVLYQQAREDLKRDVAEGRVTPQPAGEEQSRAFLERKSTEEFELGGERGNRLDLYRKQGEAVVVYSRPMGVAMEDLKREYGAARQALESSASRDLHRGFSRTLLLLAAGIWLVAFTALVYLAVKITGPVQQLTRGLGKVAAGDLSVRLPEESGDEIGTAIRAFNGMTESLSQSRERLVQVTRLASWQALARKMAHEVKNSLTPIRLTMEEVATRYAGGDGVPDGVFLEQAAQIVVDEVQTLERRVRAFSEFAAEPPVMPLDIDVNALLEERIALLRAAHPDVFYEINLAPERPLTKADPDLVKGVLTNLLENAAQAVQSGGRVLARTRVDGEKLNIEVHDSGPGLTPQARATLFEPSISFKKGGMGLGLSIAKRSALLCGGDLQTLDGELGGAGFRLVLEARG